MFIKDHFFPISENCEPAFTANDRSLITLRRIRTDHYLLSIIIYDYSLSAKARHKSFRYVIEIFVVLIQSEMESDSFCELCCES